MTNRRDSIQITVPLAILPALAHSLSIGRNTAMMCGYNLAAENLQLLNDAVQAAIPAAAHLFDEFVFCNLCAALFKTPQWSIAFKGWPSA